MVVLNFVWIIFEMMGWGGMFNVEIEEGGKGGEKGVV